MSVRKHGGIVFWNVGRIGGSFYLKRKTLADAIARHYDDDALKQVLCKIYIGSFTLMTGLYALITWG